MNRSPAALEARIAELEAQLAALQQQSDVSHEKQHLLEALFEHAVDILFIANFDSTLRYVNGAFKRMLGYGDASIKRPTWSYIVEAEQSNRLKEAIEHVMNNGFWVGRLTYVRADGSTFPGLLSTFLIYDQAGKPLARGGFIRDLTEQEQHERELQTQQAQQAQLQAEIISAQRKALHELASPLIPLAERVLVMPLIGSLDSHRTQQIIATLLEGVSVHQAKTVIIDITGVPVVDTQVAHTLLQATQALKLLGAHVMLTGIRPEVAQTVVGLGVDLSGIQTLGNLQQAIAASLR
ncbi:PAS domain S-box protein [Candidatus Viridilinea mediisalina]|uniref:PAS domain S-box protein n=1 Tax=Candidatus Viridilinea mediisalina TaxID=2024553 RepID=UPI0013FDE961|nr:PAS domain S-box protein [Candidatus Viridilinea mediisalina]